MYGYSGVAGATPLHSTSPPRYVDGVATTLPHLTRYTCLTHFVRQRCSACYGHVVLSSTIGAIIMTTQATVRMTAGTLLGTVNSAATTVADTFSTATKAVGMLNSYVSTMAEKQAIRTKLEMHTFVNKLAEETAMTETLRKKSIEEFCKDSENARIYNAEYSKVIDILTKD